MMVMMIMMSTPFHENAEDNDDGDDVSNIGNPSHLLFLILYQPVASAAECFGNDHPTLVC